MERCVPTAWSKEPCLHLTRIKNPQQTFARAILMHSIKSLLTGAGGRCLLLHLWGLEPSSKQTSKFKSVIRAPKGAAYSTVFVCFSCGLQAAYSLGPSCNWHTEASLQQPANSPALHSARLQGRVLWDGCQHNLLVQCRCWFCRTAQALTLLLKKRKKPIYRLQH